MKWHCIPEVSRFHRGLPTFSLDIVFVMDSKETSKVLGCSFPEKSAQEWCRLNVGPIAQC